MGEEQALRYIMGFCVLATLATLFFCIVITPVILVIGFAGQFWPVWNAIAAHPILASFAIVAVIVLLMFGIWLMLVIGAALMRRD
jgi:hypothetical protein